MEKNRPISHFNRLHDDKYICKPNVTITPHIQCVKTSSLNEETKRMESKLSFQTKPINSLDKYNVSDFFLENLKLSGAIDNLKDAQYIQNNVTKAETIDKAVNKIMNSKNN